MSTILYPSPVFGPIHSRRLGISLGINLLPKGGKLCSFDCIYCECGFNADHRPHNPLPTVEEIEKSLRVKLDELTRQDVKPDVLTFAGNGEPTLHPKFPQVVDRVIAVRNELCPNAKVSILSNATRILHLEIRAALLKFDNNILKLDTVNADYIRKVDRPTGMYDVEAIIEELCKFEGHLIIQTMFMKGTMNNESVDNTTDEYVLPYLETLDRIRPRKVMIYTIDRETPTHHLEKASHEELNRIADKIRALGLECSVSY